MIMSDNRETNWFELMYFFLHHDTKDNDTWHYDTKFNDTEHNGSGSQYWYAECPCSVSSC
jgi:hypothetical protein